MGESEEGCLFFDFLNLLITGCSGSGKSIFINSLLTNVLYKKSPQELKLVLIDSRHVDFEMFKGIPHLLFKEPITDNLKALSVLNLLVEEMNERYKIFMELGCRNYNEYLKLKQEKGNQIKDIPQIMVVISEFSDLLHYKDNFEKYIVNLAQKCRATGICLVISTQNTNIISANIKSNFLDKVVFRTATYMESLKILDQKGAEELVYRGEYLLKIEDYKPDKIQSFYISDKEVKKICDYIKQNNECVFDESLEERVNQITQKFLTESQNDKKEEDLELVKLATKECILAKKVSISLLQRKLNIGYMRASRLLDVLIEKGFVSNEQNNLAQRKVLITKNDFENIFNEKF